MSLFDLQDVCIAIGSIATLDLPMVVDLIKIYGLKGPYRTLTTTNWFLQALSVIPRGSWGDVSRRFTMIRWANHCIQFQKLSRSVRSDRRSELRRPLLSQTPPPPPSPCAAAAAARLRRKFVSGQFDEENPFVLISSVLIVQADEGVSFLVMDRIGDIYRSLPRRADVIVTTVGARHKCQQGHFSADCNRPRKEDRSRDDKISDDRYRRDDKKEYRYKREDKTEERAVDRSKERSQDRRMSKRGDKRPSRKHDRKVLVAEESTKSWADTDSESSSSSSSSSDSEQKEVHCLMADQTSDDEVFDFSNVEFTQEDLFSALNDMVKEYRKLSHSFEEAKAENISLKSSSIESSSDELEDIDSLNIELNKRTVENDLLRNESSELKDEVEKLTKEMSSWNQSARALHKLHEIQKSVYDKTGLGFSSGESSEGETSTQSQSAYDKFNKMSFVKANVIYDCFESITFDDQNSTKLSDNGKAGISFKDLTIPSPAG
ncbi:hypothetical protein F511_12493 [Dorcoceras hygrometricum]|uniref:Uncharacterized protein n=1 Tax=Dorcoceras hygrometricum TaxID=472368 RepID=A0A2Z7B163_9LAMI|nr:hypothetical protein F511_12493 [Dorcoceras hygrometricum]